MRYRDAIPGVLVVALRLALTPPSEWQRDWVAVLALIWVALELTPPESKSRRWSLAAGCVWLAVIYASHQAVWTFAGFRTP